MKTIAVTGAQGFVGKAIVLRLRAAGYSVLPLVRRSNSTFDSVIEWDITVPYVGPTLAVDVVVHAAAQVNDWSSNAASATVNVEGTRHVLQACAQATQCIYISSASVYDPTNTEVSLTEASPAGTNLLNAYSRTKFQGETLVQSSAIATTAIIRPHIIYGPGDMTVLPRLLEARKHGRFLVLGDGQNTISLTHIENLTAAVQNCIERQAVGTHEIYNITDARTGTVAEVLQALKSALGIPDKNLYIPYPVAMTCGVVLERVYRMAGAKNAPLVTPYLVAQMTANHVCDITKAQRELGYEPTKSFDMAFSELRYILQK